MTQDVVLVLEGQPYSDNYDMQGCRSYPTCPTFTNILLSGRQVQRLPPYSTDVYIYIWPYVAQAAVHAGVLRLGELASLVMMWVIRN